MQRRVALGRARNPPRRRCWNLAWMQRPVCRSPHPTHACRHRGSAPQSIGHCDSETPDTGQTPLPLLPSVCCLPFATIASPQLKTNSPFTENVTACNQSLELISVTLRCSCSDRSTSTQHQSDIVTTHQSSTWPHQRHNIAGQWKRSMDNLRMHGVLSRYRSVPHCLVSEPFLHITKTRTNNCGADYLLHGITLE